MRELVEYYKGVLNEIITAAQARGERRALAIHQARRMQGIVDRHNKSAEEIGTDMLSGRRPMDPDSQYARGLRIATLAGRLGAPADIHPGVRGTVTHAGPNPVDPTNLGRLRFFTQDSPGSGSKAMQLLPQQAVDAGQVERNRRFRDSRWETRKTEDGQTVYRRVKNPDASEFGF